MSHPERIVPDETEPGIVALHLKRYEFALPYCRGASVLDAGCGVGYGTAHLARVAERVVGVDVSDDAVSYARAHYAGPNVEFRVATARASVRRRLLRRRLLVRDRRARRGRGALRVRARARLEARRTTRSLDTAGRRPDARGRTIRSTSASSTPTSCARCSVVVLERRAVRPAPNRDRAPPHAAPARRAGPAPTSAGRAPRLGTLTGTSAMADVALDGIAIERDATADASELVAVCRA